MSASPPDTATDLMAASERIVSSYVSHNPVRAEELPALIGKVHGALQGLVTPPPQDPVRGEPAVAIKRSVSPERLICLECGEPFRSLKRHLSAKHGLTPDAYRGKWQLRPDYPMVAQNYALRRSELAKTIGLGHKSKAPRRKARA